MLTTQIIPDLMVREFISMSISTEIISKFLGGKHLNKIIYKARCLHKNLILVSINV
ncbi:hypothetical protein [Trichodesmium erythraeum]|uniref:hypothetical protein n=1 Tax=Trichodesmium erythraeum TaxID=1206 RepID=UPI0012DEC0ED